MFEIIENFRLKNYNTFHIDITCLYYVACSSPEQIKDFLSIHQKKDLPLLILGGGSNILFTKDFEGYVVKPEIKGIEKVIETNDFVELKVGAGENWDYFVEYCVKNNWGGVENLSLIPGNVGTCPIQNIGAYGIEVKDVITRVETLEIETRQNHTFSNNDCQFGYRDSIFKRELKGKHIITHVTFRLLKKPVFHLDYGSIKDELANFDTINLQNIRQAVINIREAKLPDPEKIGNSGSFFKNPSVTKDLANQIKLKFPEIPAYEQNDGLVKIPAGWLIEKSGWKGKRKGDAGVHEKQALVLVNHGNASGAEILNLANEIQKSVFELFGIKLEMEVNVV